MTTEELVDFVVEWLNERRTPDTILYDLNPLIKPEHMTNTMKRMGLVFRAGIQEAIALDILMQGWVKRADIIRNEQCGYLTELNE